jgi:hypothetical protein
MNTMDEQTQTIEGSLSRVDEAFDDAVDFASVVDPAHWQEPGAYYQTMPGAMRAAVSAVVDSDQHLRDELRNEYMPAMLRMGTLLDWKRVDQDYIELLQRKRLYAGQVVAADGTLARYETLSLVGAQIAISRVSYQEHSGQIVSNLMHWGREIPSNATAADIAEAVRSRGTQLRNKLPNVFLYAIMLFKERAVLLDTPPGTFKLIQGPVFPHEMLTGSGTQYIMKPCLDLLGSLIEDGAFANIVSSDTHWELLNLGRALDPGEYILVDTGVEVLEEFGRMAHYTSTRIPQYGGKSQIELFNSFRDRYGPQVVRGVLRAHPMSSPSVFYAHIDRVEEAVHMLLADAKNTGPRGYPLLVDLADQLCSGAFKAGDYVNHMNAEFARAASGSRMYQDERSTRDYKM